MIRDIKKVKLIDRLINAKRIFNQRTIKTSSLRLGGAPAHGHEVKKGNSLFSWFVVPEHPKVHQGYVYREAANLQGATNATIGKLAITLAWFWVFYNIWKVPESTFGHMPYPDTSKWTDAELGIPADDE
ncbi:unnamed protein product [Brachionus calyciflorus]|uniref:NADH dehydrogenase [ubiquinone] 1 beta subcomplex subunit 2, mitochondrial n=1 Tax=Brachionus calyciflorus TaxID=104777 RepID=A0A813SUD4_9BILA|nr:unnamed protein product [Brachionus calyciflorus]